MSSNTSCGNQRTIMSLPITSTRCSSHAISKSYETFNGDESGHKHNESKLCGSNYPIQRGPKSIYNRSQKGNIKCFKRIYHYYYKKHFHTDSKSIFTIKANTRSIPKIVVSKLAKVNHSKSNRFPKPSLFTFSPLKPILESFDKYTYDFNTDDLRSNGSHNFGFNGEYIHNFDEIYHDEIQKTAELDLINMLLIKNLLNQAIKR